MPNTNGAKKRLRQNILTRTQNRAIKSDFRTQLRKTRETIEAGDIEKAEAQYRVVAKKLDRAAGRNIVHGNTAARLKSRLQYKIKAAKAAKTGADEE